MPSEQRLNILIVDDQPGNLLALEAALADLGQNIVKARSGIEALRCLLDQDVALILLDVQMPGMDGFETAALVRERDRTRQTPIIFLTAYEQDELQLFKGYSLGAVDYLFKPIVPQILRSKVMVFVELLRKTAEIERQNELLRENHRREQERAVAEERRRWEMDRLREEAEKEKQITAALTHRTEELARTIAERVRAEEQLRIREHQQAVVAELGQHALAGGDLADLIDLAVTRAAETLRVEFCQVVPRSANAPAGELAESTNRSAPASTISVTIYGHECPIGVLECYSGQREYFSQDDVHFLQAVANVLAAAIQRQHDEDELAAMRDELALRLTEMTRLYELSTRLSNARGLQAVLEEVLEAVTSLLDTEIGLVALCNRDCQELVLQASRGLNAECLECVERVPYGEVANSAGGNWRQPIVLETGAENSLFGGYSRAAELSGYFGTCAIPLVTSSGELVGTIATYHSEARRPSVRETRLAELYCRQAAEYIDNARLSREIQEADRRKGEFLAMLGHELRNPLAPILNALHLLKRAGNDVATWQESHEILERQARHLVRLVEDLLDVARISRGKIQLRKSVLDFNEAVQNAIHTARPLLDAKNHALTVKTSDQPLRVLADPARIEQVIANLLNNAAKYTEPGGQISLTVDCEGAEAIVRVKDNGVGIGPEMLARVFEMFTQADRSIGRSEGGLGVGLTLVRRLVELHGGTVRAESQGTGQGSLFEVRLPLCSQEPDDEAPITEFHSGAVEAPDQSARRILVVDDNIDGARTLSRLLRVWGHEVAIVHDGPSGLELARTWAPDVVLLDIGLPGMSGHEVAQRLREMDGMDHAVLVALTGFGQSEDVRRSEEVGIDHHLLKPVNPAALQRILAGYQPVERSNLAYGPQ